MTTEFTKITKRLPKELIREVEEYFVSKECCDELLQWLWNNHELKRPAAEVEELTNYILKSEEAIDYMRRKNSHFYPMYKEHFLCNKKIFHLMNNTTSMTSGILMKMWH